MQPGSRWVRSPGCPGWRCAGEAQEGQPKVVTGESACPRQARLAGGSWTRQDKAGAVRERPRKVSRKVSLERAPGPGLPERELDKAGGGVQGQLGGPRSRPWAPGADSKPA